MASNYRLSLETFTNYKLAAELEKRQENRLAAANGIFAQGAFNEVFRAIEARLGDTDPRVIAYRKACDIESDAVVEASMRVGSQSYTSTMLSYLRASPRYRRVKLADAPTLEA